MEPELTQDLIRAGIHQAIHDVKTGDAWTDGALEEADFEPLLRLDEGRVNALFVMVAKRLGKALSPTKPNGGTIKVHRILTSQREMWIKEIEEYAEENAHAMEEENVAARQSNSSHGAEKMDVDAVMDEETDSKPAAKSTSDDALATGEATSDDGIVEKESAANEMKVEAPIESEEAEGDEKLEQLNLETAEMDTEKPVKDKDSDKEDEDSKPKASDDATGTPDAQKRTDDMDIKQPIEALTETTTEKSKKRKADTTNETKRKKSKGTKTRTPEEKKKRATKKRRKKTAFTDEQIDATREKLKKEFQEEKARILNELPEEYKNLWGQCGFAKWGKSWLPCLFVSPFNVGGSEMRDTWMTMYESTRNRRDAMSHLVYWYGQDNMNTAYSFCPKKQIMTHAEGVKKAHDKLPRNVQKKVDTGKKLTKSEKELVKGYEELEADLLRQPEERTAFEGFHEDYENDVFIRTLLSGDDSEDELISSDDESLSSASSSSDLDSGSDDDEVPARPKASKAKKPAAAKKPKKPAAASTMDEEMDFAEDEVSSDEDLKDEEVVPSEGSDSDEERDADYIVNEPGSKKKKGSSDKKEQKKRGRKPSKGKKPKDGPNSNSLFARNRKEHKLFRQNQETFCPILEKWKLYIKEEDTNSIEGVLQEMLTLVDEMRAPFIEAYNVSPLMKTTKELLRRKNVDTTTHKKLFKTLGQLYAEKKKLVPENFKLKTKEIERKRKGRSKQDESESSKGGDRKSRDMVSKPKKEKRESMEASSLDRNESTGSPPVSLSQSSATPSTPIRLVHSQGSTSPKPPIASPKPKVQAKKPEKTSFSLSNMINKKPSASQSSDVDVNRNSQSSQSSATKSLPLWLTSAPTSDVGSLPAEKVDRLLGLEFFQSMASYFPEEKVNRESIARSLEAAVYQWSMGQFRKEDTYWPKIRAIVAAVCGKSKPGTLLDAIVAGEFDSAMDIVTLSDDLLLHSFEGN